MKKIGFFLKNNKSGSALITVVGMLSIFIILVTTSLSIASATQRQTSMEYNRSQAYYCASSALDVFYAKYNDKSDTTFKSKIDGITADTTILSNKNISGMGDIQIVAKKDPVSGNTIITANSKYGNASSKASIVLNAAPPDPTVPLFNAASVSFSQTGFSGAFFASGSVLNKSYGSASPKDTFQVTNTGVLNSNVYTDGNLELNCNAQISQEYTNNEFSITATGNIKLTNGIIITPSSTVKTAYINAGGTFNVSESITVGSLSKPIDIFANKLEITNSPLLYSNIAIYKTPGAVTVTQNYIKNGAHITGNVYVEGDLEINGSVIIEGNLIVNGNLTIYGNAIIGKDIYCNNFVAQTNTATMQNIFCPNKITGYGASVYEPKRKATIDASKMIMPSRPVMPKPDDVFAPFTVKAEKYINAHLTEMDAAIFDTNKILSIDKSGTITGNMWQKELTIKVNDKPIWLKLDVTSIGMSKIFIERNSSFPDTPVYFCLPGEKSLNLNNSTVIMSKTTYNKLNTNSSMITNDKIFYVGNYNYTDKTITNGQPVYWLLGEGSTMTYSGGSVIEGYLYGPKATFFATRDSSNPYAKYSTDGKEIKTGSPVLIGAVVVDNVHIAGDGGILYLKPKQSGFPLA